MKTTLLLLCTLTTLTTTAQSWQWAKRGGSASSFTDFTQAEAVYSIVTDSQKNSYMLARVGKTNLNIDGVPKTNFGDNTTLLDIALVSFACDGTYRWSKIIGAGSFDAVQSLQLDAQDNVYISGRFGSCGDAQYPLRIDDDVNIPQNPSDCSLTFIAKFNSNGVFQWIRRPQPSNIGTIGSSQTIGAGHTTDSLGNNYWLVKLPLCTIANGAYTVTQAGFYILHYDAQGTFISATLTDIQKFRTQDFKFSRNPYNGLLYLTGYKTGTSAVHDVQVSGQLLTHTAFVICFNLQGQVQWYREDTATQPGSIILYNPVFDSNNNIYLGGRLLGTNFNNFLGFQTPDPFSPGFIIKVNPDATQLLWGTNNNYQGNFEGALAINNNEVVYAGYCAGNPFTWGTQSMMVSGVNEGSRPLLARFNKDTGACIGLAHLPGAVGYTHYAGGVAIDASGDFILGGSFGSTLNYATGTLTANGSQSDFFVAKYSTTPCSPLATTSFGDKVKCTLAPNPAQDYTDVSYIATGTEVLTSLQVVDMLGRTITTLNLSQEQTSIRIDTAAWASGQYLILAKTDTTIVQTLKLIVGK